jgi:group I intron endonuclease
METQSGIYKIVNLVTEQIYVGSASKSIDVRWKYHINDLNGNKHHSARLQNSWNKYGSENFKFEVLEVCSKEICIEREQFYIDLLKPFFNICPVAGNCTGRKFSEDSKKKMSVSAKKRGLNEFLLRQQKSKAILREDGAQLCKICEEFKFDFPKESLSCKKCVYKNRKSKQKVLNPKVKPRPLIATCDFNELEFDNIKQAEMFFKSNGVKFNHKTLRICIVSQEKYKGFYWSFK